MFNLLGFNIQLKIIFELKPCKNYWEKDAMEVAKTGLYKMKKLVDEAVYSVNR